jgi:hypothetical protein
MLCNRAFLDLCTYQCRFMGRVSEGGIPTTSLLCFQTPLPARPSRGEGVRTRTGGTSKMRSQPSLGFFCC